jgi:four helix bundle protein
MSYASTINSNIMYNYKKLPSWQAAIALSERIHTATADYLPTDHIGILSQMRTTSVKIVTQIALGTGKSSQTAFALALEDAQTLLYELDTQIELAQRMEVLPTSVVDSFYFQRHDLMQQLFRFTQTLVA